MTVSSVLAGRQIVVTQATHQAPELAALLADRGAIPLLYPCIAIQPPDDMRELDGCLAALAAGRFDWLVLTSANTVQILAERLRYLRLPLRAFADVRLAAIGAATNEAVINLWGRAANLVPAEHVAEGLAAALQSAAAPGQELLVPQGDLARPLLVQSLRDAGFGVTSMVAYHTTIGSGGVDLPALLPAVDAITFTSSSTARNLLARLAQDGGSRRQLEGIRLACIGPITAATLRSLGLPPAIVAATQSLEGLVEALISDWNHL